MAENELPRRGIEVTFYDPTQDIADLIHSNTSLIMIETPGSVTFEISAQYTITRPSNQPTKGLTEGVDLRKAQVDGPPSV
jgi:cystathionine beta-lyase/cystathionine gamma-synthase